MARVAPDFPSVARSSPSGMAEVTVTFNNEERWLPSEFTEVTVTRRAHRSGENQYLINGRKVRLKDVAFLTASLGQSYTVVGQGLVDQALSQRAEERRGLFEHAADLAGLRLKVGESERNLAETESNVNRLTDLLTELEPRLRRLERQALERIVATSDSVVLAVAGGIVSEPETYGFLLRNFHTIWLRATPDEHMNRVRAQGDERPMAGNPKAMDELKSILTSREALYAKAEGIVNTSGKTLEQSLQEVKDAVGKLGIS